ncbi:golgi complex component Cog3 [Blastomyces gilchristii SLH14081]|uniref:Conserved oligomeric Golgi complex subunit 3 n=1 Tax=Blastomyces gilchristii (strain SLH14081) TaxID=559298 RepID=A0A179UHU3_BLAGS|nr:golgi complex component Cog3 [Blastomyces gilchristii SLH14081]OAT06707.1 golgi complex component Cog3 [Blastomyces gilchristii SLH14081]
MTFQPDNQHRHPGAPASPAAMGAGDVLGASVKEVENDAEFARWYSSIENDLLEASYEEYQSCLDELQTAKSHLDSLLTDTTSTLDILSSLSECFQSVEAQTAAFQQQCEGLLSAQMRSSKLVEDIHENIQYYDFLDPVSRRLNAPGAGNSVRTKDFSDMLKRLDECLDYMQTHPEQKESDTYRSRYRLLLTRALTLIRGHFVSTLREISSGVAKRIADRQLNDTTMSALLYAKFRVGAADLKAIGLEIQKRAVPPVDPEQGAEAEYQSLLNELHTSFSATRGKLVIPVLRKRLNDISQAPSSSKDLVAFARASISYIRGICLDEFELWGQWFHGQQGLYDFLEAVCEPLYDHLRPRIIRETKLIKLCQLCSLLQTRYLSDPEDEGEFADPTQLDFSVLIQPALEDAQTRLVFRAQAILRDEIEKYKPRAEDLDYPARNRNLLLPGSENNKSHAVSHRRSSSIEPTTPLPKMPMVVDEDTDSPQEKYPRWDFDSGAVFEGWYPTLRTAVWLLSRIYRLVNSTVFDDLAHQIVHQTTLSLHAASTQISTKTSPTDAQLFLIKHLLLLKQQIVAFDIEFVSPDISIDFSSVTNTFWELRERGGLFNPRNLMRLLGGGLLPRVVENMLDAKVELDGRLRTVINDFTNSFKSKMTQPLASLAKSTNRSESYSNALRLTCKAIEKEVPNLRQILGEYLDDTRTKETLVGAVQDSVIQAYEDFFDGYTLTLEGGKQGVHHSKLSSMEKGRMAQEDGVWDVDTFAGWSEAVFRVGVAGLDSSEVAAAELSVEDGDVRRGSDDVSPSERQRASRNGSL